MLNPGVMMTDGGSGTARNPSKKTVAKPYTGSSVTNQSSNTVSRQFGMQTPAPVKPTPVKVVPTASQAASASARAGGGYSYTGPTAPEPAKGPGITKGQIAGGAADILFGVGSFKSAVDNAKEVITGKNEQGESVNRFKSAASVVGNTALGATNLLSTAAMVVPVAGAAAKTGVVGLNAAVKGAKVANAANAGVKGAKVAPATSKAITAAVKAKDAAIEAAAAKSAKVVGAGDLALTSAMKGAQFVGAQTKGKTASGLAAGVIALGPGAAGISGAGKATTAITQSVNAAKKVTAAADTFVPKAAKASTKVTSGGAVPNVIKPATAAAGVKAGTSGKVAQTITAADALSNAAPVTNNPFYNNNPFNNTDNKTTSIGTDSFNPSKTTTNSQSQASTTNTRVSAFNEGVVTSTGKASTPAGENTTAGTNATVVEGTKAGEGTTITTSKVTPTKVQTPSNRDNPSLPPPVDNSVIDKEINTETPAVSERENTNTQPESAKSEEGGKRTEEPTKPPARPIPPVVPIKLRDVEELNRKRKWRPSSIV